VVCHPVHEIKVTLVLPHVLDDQRLTPAIYPAGGTPFQRDTHGAKQVAFKPLHCKETQLFSGIVIFQNRRELAVG
jgi:hypothetical protein